MNFQLTPKRVGRWLALAATLLTLASVAGQVARYTINHRTYHWYTALFDLNREANLPNTYQALIIFVAAVQLTLVTVQKFKTRDRWRLSWLGLSLIFYVLALDENCALHEQCQEPLRAWLHATGLFYFSWVIAGLGFVVVVGLIFLPFVINLPPGTRWRVIASGATYVFGALIMEMLDGAFAFKRGSENLLSYQLLSNVEELFEMIGMSMFIVTMLRYMSEHVPQVALFIKPDPQRAGLAPEPRHAPAAPAPRPQHISALEPRSMM
jgi:hypothetical protein